METPKPELTPPPVPHESEDPARHDTQELPVSKGTVKRLFRINEAFTLVVAIGSAIGSLFGGYMLFIDKAEAAGKKAAVEASDQAKTADRKSDNNSEAIKRVQEEFTTHVESEAASRRRMEKKMNAMLDKLDVKDPAPTPKDDGR